MVRWPAPFCDEASTIPLSTSTSAAPLPSVIMVNSVPRSTTSTDECDTVNPIASSGTFALIAPRRSVAAQAEFTSSTDGPSITNRAPESNVTSAKPSFNSSF